MSDEEGRDLIVAKLRQRLSNLMESMSLLEIFLNKYKPEDHQCQAQVRLDKLEEYHRTFFEVAAELESYSSKSEVISVQKERFKFETYYFNFKVALQSKLPKQQSGPIPPAPPLPQGTSAPTGSHIRYPELPLLKFSGRPEDWVSFRDSFYAGVASRPEIRGVDKLQYLKSLVQGEASRLIGHIEVSEEGYNTAWKLLIRRYESQRRLVFCHIQGLHDTPAMQRESSDELLKLIDSFEEHLANLRRLGEPVDQWSSRLVFDLYIRVDPNTKREWDRHCNAIDSREYSDSTTKKEFEGDTMPSYEDFLGFLQGYAKVLPTSRQYSSSSKFEQNPRASSSVRVASHFTSGSDRSNTTSNGCYQCGQMHYIYQCPEFLHLSLRQKYDLINSKGLCTNCLCTTKHTFHSCPSRNCSKCPQKHNTLLHDSRADQQRGSNYSSGQQNRQFSGQQQQRGSQSQQGAIHQGAGQQSANSQSASQQGVSFSATPAIQASYTSQTNQSPQQVVLLPTAFANVEDGQGKILRTRCLLDSGSQCHFISHDLCQKLKLPRRRTPFPIVISGIGKSSTKATNYVSVEISSLHSDFRVKLQVLVLPDITVKLPIEDVPIADWPIPEQTTLAIPTFHKSSTVDIIVGAEYFFRILQYGRIELGDGLPLLQNTLLGWVVSGGFGKDFTQKALCNLSRSKTLDDMVKRFWHLETSHDLRGWSLDEKACEKHFVDNTVRNSEGRYVVKLPKRTDLVGRLRDNRFNAERRFYLLERKLQATPELKVQYLQFMAEYETLGHMREINDEEQSDTPQYFLPHHAVLRPESTTTKLRTVFDASCKSKSGLSLNDVLLPGPTIQDTLVAIILRFRMFPYVVAADITKMYRQILVDPTDQPLQRILWRQFPDEPLKTYQLLTVTYGTNCAPFLATRVLKQLAEDEATNYPLAAAVVHKGFYMDDVLTGSREVQELKETVKQLDELMKSAGFKLAKWASNCTEVLREIPLQNKREEEELELDHESSVTTLGL
ncbi:uncharacterized protein LOC129741756 [Uranotaenia lowii]|uniref:uncharacterized protein LOC129741756 n=1 Tax=Uranotaenia lowii TaxID=190385 RepID=UPI00247A8105|nr:uncharacterized protein LOC129741756 [Uranotaenia lowii]